MKQGLKKLNAKIEMPVAQIATRQKLHRET